MGCPAAQYHYRRLLLLPSSGKNLSRQGPAAQYHYRGPLRLPSSGKNFDRRTMSLFACISGFSAKE